MSARLIVSSIVAGKLTPNAGKCSRNVGGRIDKTDFPLVTFTTRLTVRSSNPEFSREGQIYTSAHVLVKYDSTPHSLRLTLFDAILDKLLQWRRP